MMINKRTNSMFNLEFKIFMIKFLKKIKESKKEKKESNKLIKIFINLRKRWKKKRELFK